MSEVRGDDQEYFRAIEALHMDPFLKTFFDEIRTQNKVMAETPMTNQQARSIRGEIDASLADMFGETVVFTGNISRIAGSKKSVAKYREDKEYTFKGVELVNEENRNLAINRDDPNRIYQLYLFLNKTLQSGEIDAFVARIEDIASLEFLDRMSLRRAECILQNYNPEMLKYINTALDDPNADESITAMGLEGLTYNDPDADEDIAMLVVMALNTYVGSKITFDANIGYVIALDGEVWTQEDKVLTLEGQAAPAKVEGIEWRPDPGGRDVVPHFKLHISGERSTDNCETLHVPLESVSSIQSLRYKFWQDHPKNS